MVRFQKGAVIERLRIMKMGTGQLRDASGLAPEVIQAVLRTDQAPDDVAEVLVRFLGRGLLDGRTAAAKKKEAPVVEQGVDLSGMSVAAVLRKVDAGEIDPSAAWEFESHAEIPRKTLLRELQARVKGT